MNTDPVTLTLPFLTWQGLNVLLAALGVTGATGLVWLMLTGAERDHPPKLESWFKPMAVVLGVVWIWLLGATLWGLWRVFNGVEGAPLAGGSLGLGALIAAFLGAPFVIYGTYLRHKTQRLEQEGHMTDRITKAVEQLGAEKRVDRIGRAITVWTGKTNTITHLLNENEPLNLKPRSLILREYQDSTWIEPEQDFFEGKHVEVKTWAQE